jgi:hypothetical protein
MSWLTTWDRSGPLGEKGRQLVGKVGKWHVESWHLQDCSIHLCRLRTNVLGPASKYWTYQSHAGDIGPVSLVACHQQKLGREARYGPVGRSTGVLWIMSGALLLGGSESVQICWWLVKGYHIRGPPAGSVRRAYMDWRRKRTCCVGRIFPYRVYIDSNHRDSRI